MEDFRSWSHSRRGCFLLLEATNLHQAALDPHSPLWLSPALAQYTAQERELGSRVIYYRATQSRLPSSHIPGIIITSILSWDDSFFDRYHDSVDFALVAAANNPKAVMARATVLLCKWVEEHPDDRIVMIFDRMELCLGPGPDVGTQVAGLMSVIDEFAELIVSQERLRVCMTVNKSSWPSRMSERFRYFQSSKTRGCFLNPGQLYEIEEPCW